MVKHNKLIISVLVIFFFPQCGCVVFQPQEQGEQQDFLFIEDRFDAGGPGTGNGLESLLQLFPLFLIVSVIATMGMTSPSTTTAVNCNCQCDVTLPPTTQSSPTTTTNTPCVPTSCPPEYMLLPDENVSPNCYLYSGNENRKSWDEARRTCSMTPGAFLWNANTKKEAVAVRNRFSIARGDPLWSGGKKDSNGKFVFEIDNTELVYDQENIPFGIILDVFAAGTLTDDCLIIAPLIDVFWIFGPIPCTDLASYVCEFPRKICP